MAKIKFNQDKCKGCELCTTVCPKDIVVIDDEINTKGFHPATVSDEDECIACGFCASICPDVVIEIFK
ncbi:MULTISPECIES: 4Fe-4S binding protein [unclassified Candidatus Frackibacter]|uniref:4Fe-4S binding protein n=1 Tax=unclassified Candidatus Frackibacter TaxID=2648818 RepID=UPI00087F661F|nr:MULTISPECIES: 4Fe-4S binding protein [unclassified Candidatus Frackibacter]SDC02326.1 2-oxoglutarate ferredoxin oxidoreductase, delta subunit [Candidatus Frackibacter sp. WG11]SEM69950.1 2-oxoglutarate ferredoxin oxidoreductase, delta subunit [Candidatus Frackibacter sp. WG12]SFL81183.1 2-oxoglutarate ferredoxin oxidoreductase, delta subunit [Candidatus Frackibacter sp. WG13]